eukprot:3778723-Karenia_brevis.AAC.1
MHGLDQGSTGASTTLGAKRKQGARTKRVPPVGSHAQWLESLRPDGQSGSNGYLKPQTRMRLEPKALAERACFLLL